VGDLQSSTTYLVYLKSTNDRGVSPDSNNLTFTTPELEIIPSTTTTSKPSGRENGGHDLFPDAERPDPIKPSASSSTTPESNSRTSTVQEPESPTDHQPPPYTDRGPGRDGDRDRVTDRDRDRNRDGDRDRVTDRDRDRDRDRGSAGGDIQMCPETKYQGVVWPRSRPGQMVSKDCPGDLQGVSSWRCVGQTWASPGPDLSDCISPWLAAV
ncbi:hypothetical protein EGW08_007774, partial [Elysia chlorotica]